MVQKRRFSNEPSFYLNVQFLNKNCRFYKNRYIMYRISISIRHFWQMNIMVTWKKLGKNLEKQWQNSGKLLAKKSVNNEVYEKMGGNAII